MSARIQDAPGLPGGALAPSPSSASASFGSSGAFSTKRKASPVPQPRLLLRAVAYGCQQVALGGPPPGASSVSFVNLLRQLNGAKRCGYVLRPELKPGTRLV